MGSMSTTEPAPLPRLGEVFFDVRSKARSLRISWYSDTGVAVLSIWQGGTCTGSFRLPMGDVPRLIATLQAGPPAGDSPGAAPAAPAQYGGPAGPRQPAAAGDSLHHPGGGATAPYPGQAPAAAADPYASSPYPASTAPASYPPAAAAGYPGEASGYPAPAYPAAAPPAAAQPASPYPADPYPPGPSRYAPPPVGSHPASPPYEASPYGNSGEYTRTGDFLRPAYLDPPAEPPVAD